MKTVWLFYLFKIMGEFVWVEAVSGAQASRVIEIKFKIANAEHVGVQAIAPSSYIKAGAKAEKKSKGKNKVTKPKVKQGEYNFPVPEKLYRCNCGNDTPAGRCHLQNVPLEFMVPSIPED